MGACFDMNPSRVYHPSGRSRRSPEEPRRKRQAVFAQQLIPHASGRGRVLSFTAIDADSYIVRPGPRLVDGVELLADLLHPGT